MGFSVLPSGSAPISRGKHSFTSENIYSSHSNLMKQSEPISLIAKQIGVPNLTNASPNSLTEGRATLECTVKGGRRVSINISGTELDIPYKSASHVFLPKDSEQQILDWLKNPTTLINKPLENQTIEEQDRLKKRIPYTESDIPRALTQFDQKYHCSWHRMKNDSFVSPITLQIINDFRSANLEKHKASVRMEYPNIINIGDWLKSFEKEKKKTTRKPSF